MSGYRDPYESSNTDYIRHNYADGDEFNPYSTNPAAVSRTPSQHQNLQSDFYATRSRSGHGHDRSESMGYSSRLSTRHESSLPPIPPEEHLDLPYPGNGKERADDPYEAPLSRSRGTLKKSPTSASKHSMNPLSRTDTRQTLTAVAATKNE